MAREYMEPHWVPGGVLNASLALSPVPLNKPARPVFISSLFYPRGCEGSERADNLPEVTEPEVAGAGLEPRSV